MSGCITSPQFILDPFVLNIFLSKHDILLLRTKASLLWSLWTGVLSLGLLLGTFHNSLMFTSVFPRSPQEGPCYSEGNVLFEFTLLLGSLYLLTERVLVLHHNFCSRITKTPLQDSTHLVHTIVTDCVSNRPVKQSAVSIFTRTPLLLFFRQLWHIDH